MFYIYIGDSPIFPLKEGNNESTFLPPATTMEGYFIETFRAVLNLRHERSCIARRGRRFKRAA